MLTQFWAQPWSFSAYESTREDAPLPPPLPAPPREQRTRYSVAGVILDEDDFIDYATSSLSWVDSIGDPEPGPQAPFVPTSNPLRLHTEQKLVAPATTFYTQLLSPVVIARPASAPPEKSRSRAQVTGHAGATVGQNGDVFYQIANRRRSSSVDATVARAVTSRASAQRLSVTAPDAGPAADPAVPSSVREGPPAARPHHRGSMRGWVHYERRSSVVGTAGSVAKSADDPLSPSHRAPQPYPPQRPATPTHGTRPRAHSKQRSSPASGGGRTAGPLGSAPTGGVSPRRPPPHRGGGEEAGSTPDASPSGRRPASATRRPSALSFVNFSSADAPKLMKAVSKSGGVGKHKRAASHGRPGPGHQDEHPHL